jgi:hypothetical protein
MIYLGVLVTLWVDVKSTLTTFRQRTSIVVSIFLLEKLPAYYQKAGFI